MHRILFAVLISVFFLSCNSDKVPETKAISSRIEVQNEWMRPVNTGANSAAYLSIINGTAKADTLLSVSSDAFEMAEVHESYVTEDGLSGMRPARNLSIDSGDSLVLQPGGLHIMLMNAQKTITEHDTITVNLSFKTSGIIPIQISADNRN